MVNADDIINHQLLDSIYKNDFKHQRQEYINYANHTLLVLIEDLYDDHRKISPIDIEESE